MESHTTETHTVKTTTEPKPRRAAVNALATVGFIALLLLGITLAIYAARYIPETASKLTTSLNFGTSSTTPPTLTVVSATSTNAEPTSFTITSGNPTGGTYQTTALMPSTQPSRSASQAAPAYSGTSHTPSTHQVATLHGLPDLSVTILATGYLAGDSTDSFVPASIIPPGARPAVKFSIANNGTNTTGPWNFLAEISTINHYVFNSPIEQSMAPGDHIVFTMGFNQAVPGPAQVITVVADPNNLIQESNEGNNSASAAVAVTATGN